MEKELVVTEEGLKKLQSELEYLKVNKRQEIVEQIRVALGYGDLSENSEYDEAKNEQAKNEERILEIEEQLKNVRVISEDEIKTDAVSIGTTVKIIYLDGSDDEETVSIVGSTESDAAHGKYSDQSPIGIALLGAKVGEEVTVSAPNGAYKIKVEEISK